MEVVVSSSLITSATPSWCPSPILAWVFSYRMQLFMNFFKMGLSNRVLSSNNCSRVGHFCQMSPSGVDCSSVSPPWATIPVRKLSPVWSSLCRLQLPPGLSTCSSVSPSWLLHCALLCATGNSLHHHSLHSRLQENFCSSTWGTSSPSFFTNLDICRAVSITFSPSSPPPLVHSLSYSFFKMLSQRHCQHQWWAQLWTVAGVS